MMTRIIPEILRMILMKTSKLSVHLKLALSAKFLQVIEMLTETLILTLYDHLVKLHVKYTHGISTTNKSNVPITLLYQFH